jgi:hypothetical protein
MRQMTVYSPYRAEIERIPNKRCPEMPLYRYSVLDERTDEQVFEGVAADMRDAIDSINAWINYLEIAAAA